MKKLFSIFTILLVQYAFSQASVEDRTAYEEYESSVIYIQMKSGTVFGDVIIDRSHSELLIGYPELKVFFGQGVITEMKLEFKKLAKRSEKFNRIYRAKVADGVDLDALVKELKQLNYVVISEKIPSYKLSLVPNDPDYSTASKRWHLDQVSAELAWNITQGCDSVKIAIVDDAVMTNHEDLQSKIYTNLGEIPANGIDDDGNGYIDDINGFDVADNDPNASPPPSATSSYFSHGTHVAGIAGGASNNSIGSSSLGFNSSIIPIKTKSNSSTNPASLTNPMQGVEYAIIIGADVINMSWGSYASSAINQMVFDQANIEGIICVAAGGNSSLPIIPYPANYNGVISVLATDTSDDLASFSNFSEELHVFAPGVNIWSAEAGSTSSYGFKSGTSMAAPLAAGLIALMLCNSPNYSLFDIEYCLRYNSDMISSMVIPGFTIPRINAHQTLMCTLPVFNSCPPNGCELMVNGSFEIPGFSNLSTYTLLGMQLGELCGWNEHLSADVFPLDVSASNHFGHMQCAFNLASESQSESLITKDPLNLIPGATYQLEFDYCVMRQVLLTAGDHLDSIAIKLMSNSWTPTPGVVAIDSTILLGAILDPPLDYIHPQISNWVQNAVAPDSLFHHYVMTFVAPSDTHFQTMLIQPVSDYPTLLWDAVMGLGIDNISLRPVTDVTATASNYSPLSNDCLTLTATTPGTYVYWEPSHLFADPTLAVQNICLDTMETCPGGTLEFTATAMDTTVGCGSSDTVVLNIQGVDMDSPAFNATVLADYYDCGSVAYITPPTASDNCSGTIVGVPNVTFPITALGSTTVITWTYDDGNGNTSSQTQNVIIASPSVPVPDIAVLPDISGVCVVSPVTPSAIDSCVGAIDGIPDITFPISAQGTTTITWTYDNGNGGISTQIQNVIIADVTAPVPNITALADINGECDVTPSAPLAADFCTGVITGTSNVTFPITTPGITVVTWTYDDGNGNFSTQTQNVLIADSTGPVPNLVFLPNLNGQCEITPFVPSATDNCTGTSTGTPDIAFPITTQGTTVVTWTYVDGIGNISTQTQNIIVSDITSPVADLAFLADINSECEVVPTPPTATDNCSGVITGIPDVTFPITASGTTTITWTFDDGNGNSTTQTQGVVITPINNGVTQLDALTLSADAAGYSYQWVDCESGNVPVPGATSQIFTPTIAGSYACILDNGTCSVTTSCLTSSVGIIENDFGNGLQLYPNPTNGKFFIELGGNYQSVTYTLTDSKGRLIESNAYQEAHQLNIILKEPAGVYIVIVESENRRAVLRIVKE